MKEWNSHVQYECWWRVQIKPTITHNLHHNQLHSHDWPSPYVQRFILNKNVWLWIVERMHLMICMIAWMTSGQEIKPNEWLKMYLIRICYLSDPSRKWLYYIRKPNPKWKCTRINCIGNKLVRFSFFFRLQNRTRTHWHYFHVPFV